MCSPVNLASYQRTAATSGMMLCLKTRLAVLNELPVDWQACSLQAHPFFPPSSLMYSKTAAPGQVTVGGEGSGCCMDSRMS